MSRLHPSIVSHRLPFSFPLLCLSFGLCCIILAFDAVEDGRWGFRSMSTIFICPTYSAIHHVYMFVMSIQHPTTLMERDSHLTWLLTVRKCKFYVYLLLIPFGFALLSAYTAIVSAGPYLPYEGLPLWLCITIMLQAIAVFLLIATATYPEEEGAIHLSDNEPNAVPKHWLRKLVSSKYSLNPTMPFNKWILALALFTSISLLTLSMLDYTSSPLGLNTIAPSLFILLVCFVLIAYADRQLEDDEPRPYLYTHLPPASDFVRVDMRYIYLALSFVLAISFFWGASMIFYYGDMVLLGIVEAMLGWTSSLLVTAGMVLPLCRELEPWSWSTGPIAIPPTEDLEGATAPNTAMPASNLAAGLAVSDRSLGS